MIVDAIKVLDDCAHCCTLIRTIAHTCYGTGYGAMREYAKGVVEGVFSGVLERTTGVHDANVIVKPGHTYWANDMGRETTTHGKIRLSSNASLPASVP